MELQATLRKNLGTSASNKIRQEKQIPAELYGHNTANLHLAVQGREFKKVYEEVGESQVVTLVVDSKKHPVLIHDVRVDALHGGVIHVDFYEVKMDEEIVTNVELEFINESPAIKEKKGNLNKTITEIEVEALPANLPESIIVDISKLIEVGDSIHVKDLAIPKNVKVFLDPETAVVSIVELVKEEKVEAPVLSVDDIKVEGEEKKAEREEEKKEEGK